MGVAEAVTGPVSQLTLASSLPPLLPCPPFQKKGEERRGEERRGEGRKEGRKKKERKKKERKKGKKERKKESEVAQSCLTLCDPMDCSLPGASVLGIFQAGTLE